MTTNMADMLMNSMLVGLLAVSVGILLLFQYIQPEPYLDEIFHIPQAQKYCLYKFNEWDAMITTLPGLYVVSFLLLQIMAVVSRTNINVLCSVWWLRCTNILFMMGNAWILYHILWKIHFKEQATRKSKVNLT